MLDTGDPTLTNKAKDLVSDGDAESLAKARATLETVASPFGGAATITAADLINEATRIKRTFADAILTEVDTLGTAELAHTNAAYIGALDGNVAGQPGVTFSADSKTMVFTFPLSPGQTQTTQILSYLAGGKDIYTYEQAVDDNGDPRFESDGTTPIYALDDNGNKIVSGFSEAALETDAGYAEGSYDTYLKYVSYDDLLKYGATPTGSIDADTEEMIFSWGDSSSWGDETNSLNTADKNPLTLLSKPAGLDSSSDDYIDYVITKPGWYDFTQVGGSGDGAKYVTVTQEIDGEAVTRIVGVELNFSRDMFGDKTPGDDQITDPGATVAVVPKGNGQLAADESAINTAELERLRAQAATPTAAGGAGAGAGTGITDEGARLAAGFKAVPIDAQIVEEGFKLVPDDAQILEAGSKAVPEGAEVLEAGSKAVPEDAEVLQAGSKAVADNAALLNNNQIAVDANSDLLRPDQEALEADQKAVPDNALITSTVPLQVPDINNSLQLPNERRSPLSENNSMGFQGESADMAAMTLGDGGGGSGATDSAGSGSGELAQQLNNFLQGEGDGEGVGDAEEARGQGAAGQGQGTGGDAALGEDQTPPTQRRRGLMLQPLMAEPLAQDEQKTSSSLLRNLSEGSLMGNNLLDALALGAGVLYAIYAPKAVDSGKKGWKKLIHRFRKQANGGSIPIPEKNVLSVFAMKMPNGGERLMAARVGMGGIEVLAQQDLPETVRLDDADSATQVDFGVSQLLSKIEGQRFDLALLGPKLRGQASLVQAVAKDSQLLNTRTLIDRLNGCTSRELNLLQEWLNKPSSTPPESSPVFDLLSDQQKRYGSDLAKEQASMSSLIELSVAMGWSQNQEAA